MWKTLNAQQYDEVIMVHPYDERRMQNINLHTKQTQYILH